MEIFDWLGDAEIIVGEFVVDFPQTKIVSNDRIVKLEPLAMELLCYLINRKGEYVSQRDLLENVWDGRYVSDNAIRRVVKKLRDSLGDDPKAPRYIKTVPSKGYLLIANVEIKEKASSDSDAQSGEATSNEVNKGLESNTSLKKASGIKTKRTLIAASLAAVIFTSGYIFTEKRTKDEPVIEVIADFQGEKIWANQNPKNNLIVFSHRKTQTDSYNLYLKNSDSNSLRQLTRGEANHYSATWSSDGDKLAYQEQEADNVKLVIATFDESMKVLSREVIHEYNTLQPGLIWSPDNSELYFVDRQSRSHPYSFFAINISNKSLRQVTFPDIEGHGDYAAKFSPSGEYLAVLRYKRNDRVHLMIFNNENGKIETNKKIDIAPLTLTWNQESSKVVMADGPIVLSYTLEDGILNTHFNKVDHVSALFQPCGEQCLLGTQSPQNTKDVIERINPWALENQSSTEVFEFRLDGNEGHPIYTKDTGKILFSSKTNDKVLLMLHSVSGEHTVVAEFDTNRHITNLKYHPTEQLILGLIDQQLFVLDLSNSEVSYLTPQMEMAQRPNWDSTGQNIYYTRSQFGTHSLLKLNLENKTVETVAQDIIEARESESGDLIYMLNTQGHLIQSPINNVAQGVKVTDIPIDSNVSWHLLGEDLYYTSAKGNDYYLNRLNLNNKKLDSLLWQPNAYYARFEIHHTGNKLLQVQDTILNSKLVKFNEASLLKK